MQEKLKDRKRTNEENREREREKKTMKERFDAENPDDEIQLT